MDEINITQFMDLKQTPRQSLIDELMAYQRKIFEKMEDDDLRGNVIICRVKNYHNRLLREAGLSEAPEF
jgi:hypothetical protein